MGQYYKPVILSESNEIVGYWDAYKTNNGRKLMEHSYIGNHLCNCVMNYLLSLAVPARVVWAGDYADNEKKKKRNLYFIVDGEEKQLKYDCKTNDDIRFIINEDKKEVVDLWDLTTIDDLVINPLPLLTAEGNGRGCGDYHGLDAKYVGTWARNLIRVAVYQDKNTAKLESEGYTFINPKFVEGYTLMKKLSTIADLVDKSFIDSVYNYSDDERYIKSLKESVSKIRKAIPKKKKEKKEEKAEMKA